jgi:thiol:disulfide interchange protein DsbD
MRTRILCLTLLALLALPAWAQDPVKWSARLDPADARAGEGARVIVAAKIDAPWHLYSLTRVSGPVPTSITLAPGKALTAAGKPVQPPPIKKHDPNFETQVELYEGAVAFGLPVKLAPGLKGAQKATVKVRFQVCTDRSCLPPTTVQVPVAFTVPAGPARPNRAAAVTAVPPQPPGAKKAEGETPAIATTGSRNTGSGEPRAESTSAPSAANGSFNDRIKQAQSRGLGAFLWLALSMGFLALLTPCVFPMVPVTVSFFSKQQETGRGGLRGPVAYCLGIIATFTGLGLFITLLFGATGIQQFATNPWVNLAMATLFIVLALNLFGVFEIIVPAWLLNRAHSGSQKGGLLGPMLMGLTFTLTSFTCTVPFVGTLLVATAKGSTLWPLAGMLAFSTAFASPFFLLALFPQWLARLPKSGSWLTSVKAYMGFLELAAAVKFLSNTDLVWQTMLLTRPVFLSIWSTIAIVAAGYLLGWFRLPHDGPVQPGWMRRGLGLATAIVGIWCLGAIGGRSLGELDAFLPPESYGAKPGTAFAAGKIPWEHDYDAAVARAKSEGKALFINFTGYT